MEKSDAIASMGVNAQGGASVSPLLGPTMMKAALAANDRLKLYLTLLQAAAAHAQHPEKRAPDLAADIGGAGIVHREDAAWLLELPGTASMDGETIRLPDLPRLAILISDDLARMARPVVDGAEADADLARRVKQWQVYLMQLSGPVLDTRALSALSHGQRQHGDSLHITVMDLHKALNRRAASLSTHTVAGAHAWQLADDGSDVPRVEAFMRGLERTRALKGDHPGLETAATRDGNRLLIQNDIGTNDAHVLVLQVDTASQPVTTTLTYSDLHRQRFAFFQRQLEEVGATWSAVADRRSDGLNAGETYYLAHARLEAAEEATLQRQLEGIAERIVFLIDWNRARKRLLQFVDRDSAVEVLTEAARRRVGHMSWLAAGGERLVWNAMAAQGASVFRLGDRLDDVLGDDTARDFLVEVLALSARAAAGHQPVNLIDDEVRALLARRLQGRRGEVDLLQEHAALCHAIAQGLAEALSRSAGFQVATAARLAAQAKTWERQADQIVMRARTLADRQPQWKPLARLVERSDDVADALEEACFVHHLLAEHLERDTRGRGSIGRAPLEVLRALADAVLAATQEHIKALAVAATLGEASDARDHDDFLAASWHVLQAERQCDELLRNARRALAADGRERADAMGFMLGTEFAAALEAASDALLALGYGVRERAFHRIEAPQP
jgi:uncharacterized protein Yka (UPF0111/DUF47 family)